MKSFVGGPERTQRPMSGGRRAPAQRAGSAVPLAGGGGQRWSRDTAVGAGRSRGAAGTGPSPPPGRRLASPAASASLPRGGGGSTPTGGVVPAFHEEGGARPLIG